MRVPTTTRNGPVRICPNRASRTRGQHPSYNCRWTGPRGLHNVNTNRTSLTTRTGSAGAGCPGSGGSTVNPTYDTADRITSAGYTYDNHGRTSAAPLSAGTAALTYFTTDMVYRQTIGTKRQTWDLDPALRLRGWTTETNTGGWVNTGTKINHYAGDADSPTWISEGGGAITRNVAGITGALAATTSASGSIKLLLTTLHGDAGQTISLTNPTTIDTTTAVGISETDEFGNPKPSTSTGRYNWLGAQQRSTETVGNSLVLMGVRLYSAASGRFLTVDPVLGGSANAYDYSEQDPLNKFDLDGKCVRYMGWACKTGKAVKNVVTWNNVSRLAAFGSFGVCIFGGPWTCAAALALSTIASARAKAGNFGWKFYAWLPYYAAWSVLSWTPGYWVYRAVGAFRGSWVVQAKIGFLTSFYPNKWFWPGY